MFKYLPHTEADIQSMLETIGVSNVDALYEDVPEVLRNPPLNMPESHSEMALLRHFQYLADKTKTLTPFIGAGAYDHYTPSIIRPLIERQEFLTSYTPYQPEISQGTLHYIFEFQSMITRLTGMDVANASMYDGATATAEAMFMAEAITKRQTLLVSDTLNPSVIEILETYAHYKGLHIVMLENEKGVTSLNALKASMNENVAGVIVQNPNIYGLIEDYEGFSEIIHAMKGLFIVNMDPSTLSHLKPASEIGADIAVGEAQSLGIPLSYGGPYIGYMATKEAYVRKMPGRICGITEDKKGRQAFTLTLQAREQHIRRAKANSNICSNQSLLALFVTIYLSVMGKKGLFEAGQQSIDKAHYLYDQLIQKGFKDPFKKPFFKEFTLKYDGNISLLKEAAKKEGFLAPLDLSKLGLEKGLISFAVTEKRTIQELDQLASCLGGVL